MGEGQGEGVQQESERCLSMNGQTLSRPERNEVSLWFIEIHSIIPVGTGSDFHRDGIAMWLKGHYRAINAVYQLNVVSVGEGLVADVPPAPFRARLRP